jgi:hypothetical protein
LFHDISTLALGNMMIMGFKVNRHSSQISLLMHNIIHVNNTVLTYNDTTLQILQKGKPSAK